MRASNNATKMQCIEIHSPDNLIDTLISLKKEGFVFRGQAKASWSLTPSAFREAIRDQREQLFPVSKNLIITQWIHSPEVLSCINGQFWGPPISNPSQLYGFSPLCKWLIFLIQYNYYRHKYSEDNPTKISEEEKNFLDQYAAYGGKDYWAQKSTFVHFFNSYLPSLMKYILADRVHHQPIFEDITGLDETYPQHYADPTSILDWSYNPLIAIFFALELDKEIAYDSPIIFSTRLPNEPFSIYALKINQKQGPIQLRPKCPSIYNQRAERQEGTFTYFSKACSFFMTHAIFPMVENFVGEASFTLKKINFSPSQKHIDHLRVLLNNVKISRKFLLPDA